MARPIKWRKIEYTPVVSNFVPATEEAEVMCPKNILKLEEIEAIRLKDLEGLEQEECATRMEVSRPTFQRILLAAREKIADSLINGKSITIEGGNSTKNICHLVCQNCGKELDESYENYIIGEDGQKKYKCPECGSEDILCQKPVTGSFCKKHCRRHGNH